MTGRILLGTQSWNFKAWCGPFYPPGTWSSAMLGFYGLNFPTIEVDATFYGLPAEAVLLDWRAQVPPGFRFALKVPQQITHDARLIDVEPALERFVDRASVFGDQLGPCLIQLSPDYLPTAENRAALSDFVPLLASGVKWAVEFRHPAWSDQPVLDLLGRYGIAHALADGKWYPRHLLLELAKNPTASFSYFRWMGRGRRLTDYSRAQVDRDDDRKVWAATLQSMAGAVETVFGYFNNQYEGHSPHSVREMQRLVGLRPVDPLSFHPQAELF